MNDATYALIGVVVGAAVPAVAGIWTGILSGKQEERARTAAREDRRNDHRLALIASWREGLAGVVATTGDVGHGGEGNPIYREGWYLSLRPYLSEQGRQAAEPGPRTMVVMGAAPFLYSLADEIARIEREWGLA